MPNRFSLTDLAAAIVAGFILLSLSQAIIGCGGDGGGASVASDDEIAAIRKARREDRSYALGGARGQARKMQNSTQIRGLHQQLVVFSNGNNQFFPGRSTIGANKPAMQASAFQYGAAAPTHTDQAIALAILFNNDAFAPDYLISPLEPAMKKAADTTTATNTVEEAAPKRGSITIKPNNCSYAAISWSDRNATSPSLRDEWYSTQNGLAPCIADRSKKIADNIEYTSVHATTTSDASADWKGQIAWNDNSTRSQDTGLIDGRQIKIGTLQGGGVPDDIFDGAAAGPLTATANVWFSYTK